MRKTKFTKKDYARMIELEEEAIENYLNETGWKVESWLHEDESKEWRKLYDIYKLT